MKILHLIKGMAAGFVGVGIGIFIFFSAGQIIFRDFYKPFVVLSGSMEPVIKVGSVVFSRRADTYAVGEVISFSPTGKKSDIVTHRVTSNEEALYETKGDANDDPDTWLLKKEQIIGKVEFSLPYLGYIVDFAKTPQGFILFVIIPATIIVYEEFKSIKDELARTIKKFRNRKINITLEQEHKLNSILIPPALAYSPHPKNRINILAVLLPLIGVVFVVTFSVSKAFFLDREQNTSNILGAASVFPTPTPTPSPSPTPTFTPEPTITPEPTP